MTFRRSAPSLSYDSVIPVDSKSIIDTGDVGNQLDDATNSVKKNRVRIAQDYLKGKPIFILSAGLKGRLENGWINPWRKLPQQRTMGLITGETGPKDAVATTTSELGTPKVRSLDIFQGSESRNVSLISENEHLSTRTTRHSPKSATLPKYHDASERPRVQPSNRQPNSGWLKRSHTKAHESLFVPSSPCPTNTMSTLSSSQKSRFDYSQDQNIRQTSCSGVHLSSEVEPNLSPPNKKPCLDNLSRRVSLEGPMNLTLCTSQQGETNAKSIDPQPPNSFLSFNETDDERSYISSANEVRNSSFEMRNSPDKRSQSKMVGDSGVKRSGFALLSQMYGSGTNQGQQITSAQIISGQPQMQDPFLSMHSTTLANTDIQLGIDQETISDKSSASDSSSKVTCLSEKRHFRHNYHISSGDRLHRQTKDIYAIQRSSVESESGSTENRLSIVPSHRESTAFEVGEKRQIAGAVEKSNLDQKSKSRNRFFERSCETADGSYQKTNSSLPPSQLSEKSDRNEQDTSRNEASAMILPFSVSTSAGNSGKQDSQGPVRGGMNESALNRAIAEAGSFLQSPDLVKEHRLSFQSGRGSNSFTSASIKK